MAPTNTTSILIVDDDAINGLFLAEALNEAGHSARHCADPEQALALCARSEFSWILVDLRMPGLDGLAFIARLAEKRPAITRTTVLIGMSADLDKTTATRLLAAGYHHALAKPIARATLLALITGDKPAQKSLRTAPVPSASVEAVMLDDEAGLQALGSSEALQAIRALFATELAQQLPKLAQALSEGHFQAAHEIAHKLKAGCQLSGAARLRVLLDLASSRCASASDYAVLMSTGEQTIDAINMRRNEPVADPQ